MNRECVVTVPNKYSQQWRKETYREARPDPHHTEQNEAYNIFASFS